MSLEHKTGHEDEALDHLVEQFRRQTKIRQVVSTWMSQVQDVEDAFWQLVTERWLDTAIGLQLDGLGQIVGVQRDGLSDDDFRVILKAQVMVNRSEGSIEDVIGFLAFTTGFPVQVVEHAPAAFDATIIGELASQDIADWLAKFLNTGKAAGILAHLIYGLSPPAELFRFDSGPGYDQGKYAGAI